MTCSPLPNYIRTHRKRAHLTQGEVAFLLGVRDGAVVCRHERFRQHPNLQTVVAYEILFRTPVRTLFGGVNREVEHRLASRVQLLMRRLSRTGGSRLTERKLETLNAVLGEQGTPSHAWSR
jgi:DNA-binding XRE family transcriptional regulator